MQNEDFQSHDKGFQGGSSPNENFKQQTKTNKNKQQNLFTLVI